MQESEFYSVVLSELTDAELVEVIGREMSRRERPGIVCMLEPTGIGTHTHYASVFADDEVQSMPAYEQLSLLAALLAEGKQVARRVAQP